MNSATRRLAYTWVTALLVAPNLASAGQDDLRLIDAAAGQDRAAVLALLDEGVDVNVTRADGVAALLYAAHWECIWCWFIARNRDS